MRDEKRFEVLNDVRVIPIMPTTGTALSYACFLWGLALAAMLFVFI